MITCGHVKNVPSLPPSLSTSLPPSLPPSFPPPPPYPSPAPHTSSEAIHGWATIWKLPEQRDSPA